MSTEVSRASRVRALNYLKKHGHGRFYDIFDASKLNAREISAHQLMVDLEDKGYIEKMPRRSGAAAGNYHLTQRGKRYLRL